METNCLNLSICLEYLGLMVYFQELIFTIMQLIFFLENRTGKITLNIYLVSVTEILHPCSNHGKGALLISSGYVPRIIRGKKCLYLFDSYSEDGEVNISHNSKVFIIFDPFSNFDLRST